MARVKATTVEPFCMPGNPSSGYGAKVIPPLKRNLLGQYGYSASASDAQRHRALNQAVKEHGASEISKHLRALVTLQRWNPPTHDIMLSDFEYMRHKYYPDREKVYKTVGY